MNFNALLENKKLLFGIIGGVVLVLAIVIAMSVSKGAGNTEVVPKEPVIKEPMSILTTDNVGKALAIQALLAREGIHVERVPDGTKSTLMLEKYTMSERDRALLAIVKSGLVDHNIGLEIFDKGDFTSTKDDKRIRLARAINGELARLIRKIPPIENASVFVSIQAPTIFTSEKKPTTATVQLTMPSGDKLDKIKVKAIVNLLLGSVQGLETQNISITDTNGNVYTSIMSAENTMLEKIEENDEYMKRKIMAQLDRLVGKGNYVVSVSTYLRQAPLEKSQVLYDPQQTAVLSSQNFTESLGDKSQDKNRMSAAVSTYLPGGLPVAPDSSAARNYTRRADENQYGVSKTQLAEFLKPGIIEDISIGITLDQNALPDNTTIKQLKELVAKSASPKVSAENVEIAFSTATPPILASDRPMQMPKVEESGNPWWTAAVLLGGILVAGLMAITGKVKSNSLKQQKEIQSIIERTEFQENQLKEMNNATNTLLAQQEEIRHSLANGIIQQPQSQIGISDTINGIKEEIEDEKEFAIHLKSWIES